MGSLAPIKIGADPAKRQPSEGKDLAHRCYDATLAFFLQTLPLNPTVHGCVSRQLSTRWTLPTTLTHNSFTTGTEANGSLNDGSLNDDFNANKGEERMSGALGVFFDGERRNPEDNDLTGTGHGCMIVQDFMPEESMYWCSSGTGAT